MALRLLDLDETTRKLMLEEVDADIAAGDLYMSKRLSAIGHRDYPALLKQAIERHDDTWLTAQLNANGRLNATEERHNRSGSVSTVAVPFTAAETLAEGEFNRFYIRALCRRALASGQAHLVVYRAKAVENPRTVSQVLIDTEVNATTLLADLRTNIGFDTALGLPGGPNSGLSARLP